MSLLEFAVAIVLVWALACCSLILGGCISVCVLACASRRARYERPAALFVGRLSDTNAAHHHQQQKSSELYLD